MAVSAEQTSIYQKHLDSKVRIADSEQEYLICIVKPNKVIPQIAHQLLYLILKDFLRESSFV